MFILLLGTIAISGYFYIYLGVVPSVVFWLIAIVIILTISPSKGGYHTDNCDGDDTKTEGVADKTLENKTHADKLTY